MIYRTIPPNPSLAPWVRFFWVLEGGDPDGYTHRSMADGCAELIFHYLGAFDELSSNERIHSFRSGLHAQSDHVRRFATGARFGIFGAYLYPFALPRLFGISACELSNGMPDLTVLAGREGAELEERMMLAPDHRSRCRILAAFLERRLSQRRDDAHPVVAAVRYAVHSAGAFTVRELARRFNLSERQLERKFLDYAGFTPKHYARIIRFGAVCDRYGHTGGKTLTDIAHETGYYDQSHFIRDFKAFSGCHPGTYFSGRADGTEWREV